MPKRKLHSRILCGVSVAAALAALSSTALGDDRTEARKRFKSGMDLIARGSYERGISELKKAYEIKPHPNVLFNIGRAYAESGDLENAILAYKEYLASGPPDADDVQKIVTQIQSRLDRQKAALAAAQGGPTGPAAPTGPTGPAGETGPTGVGPTGPATPAERAPDKAEDKVAIAARTEDVFQETVVTASRAAQSPVDAPNSTSIITGQDIRLSGITKWQELFRRLAGVDVNIMTGGDTEVSIRGFNSRLSNKMLVLIDYRSVYIDLLASTFWETFPIDVEQVERIEVVRGPGSALYGANAFAGVINIITKKPGEGRSGFRTGIGTNGNLFGSVTATRRDGEFAYRASAGYTQEPRWTKEVGRGRNDTTYFPGTEKSPGLGSQNSRFDLQVTRRLGKETELAVGGGYASVFRNLQGIGPFNEYALRGNVLDTEMALTSKHVSLRSFFYYFDVMAGRDHDYAGQSLYLSRPRTYVGDVFLEYTDQFNTGASISHDVHVGVNYRLKEVRWSYLDRERKENWIGALLQDTIKFGKHVSLVVSGRADYVPLLQKVVPSPRGALIMKPTDQSAFRVSASTAFRTPSFLESYLDLPIVAPTSSGAQLNSRGKSSPDARVDLRRERVLSLDAGYVNQDSDLVNFEVTAYYLQVKDLVGLVDNRIVTPNSAYGINGLDPETGRYTVGWGGFGNQCATYHAYGSELSTRLFPVEGLDFFANYTINLQRVDIPGGCPVVKDQKTSKHKVNAGVQARTKPGIDGELTFHYASEQLWSEQQVPTDGSIDIQNRLFAQPGYFLVNGRVGYRFAKDRADVSVVGFNLLNNQHRQHPLGQKVGQRIMGFVSYKF
ncbi:MAG: TonB-dependent receptor [Polyangiaceae bacterium]|nr:TonB-dependent receptor [Polyangiaceae bacterium]